MLGSLFETSVAKTLTSLKYLEINDCHGLKHIVTQARLKRNEKENMVEDGHDFQTHLSMFLNLKKLYIMSCNLLQHIFPVSFVGGMVKSNDTCHQLQKNTQIELPTLQDLTLDDIPNYIIPYSYYVRCPSLKTLSLGVGRYVEFFTLNSSSNASDSDYIKINV